MKGAGIASVGVVVVASSTFAQLCAGWTAVLPIAALAIYGWYHGIFLAVVAGLQILASFIVACACAQPVAAILATFGVSPEHALAMAYLILCGASLVIIRLAVGAWVPAGAVRLGQVVDGVGGACAGAVGGAILGGVLLVGWSLAPLPDWIRFDASHLPFDGGRHVLWTLARWVTADAASAHALFDGALPASTAAATGVVRASEPFVDADGDGAYDAATDSDAAAERFLDLDGDGAFTPDMRWADPAGLGRRRIGLHDCYRLADWHRVRCLHAPVLTSGDAAEIREDHPLEEPLYRAAATDPDMNGALSYRVRPAPGEEAVDVAIDPATGAVTLLVPADFETKKRLDFVVEVRDGTGLTDEKRVSVRIRDVALQ